MERFDWGPKTYEENCERLILIAQLAGLLHDIGHAPFSHGSESDSLLGNKRHEDFSADIVTTEELGIKDIIESKLGNWGITAEEIAALISGGGRPTATAFVPEIISSAWDVDKMDYLIRDSQYCGVRYGLYDIGRLLDTLTLYDEDPSGSLLLGIEWDGVHAIEGFIFARYFMFTQVYFHHVRRSYDLILGEFIRSLLKNEYGVDHYPDDVREYVKWDDHRVFSKASEQGDTSQKNLAWRLTSRQHLKPVHTTEEHPDPLVARKALWQLPKVIREKFPGVLVWPDQASDHPERFRKEELRVHLPTLGWRSLHTVSKALQGLEEIAQVRVYADVRGDDSLMDKIGGFCQQFMS